ncbi:enoyl-CoA hydratase/isomerase family protein [Oceanithermus desulfurans]|uniref:3-hydroxybutyryl-CoA dehydratase n=2 Tax=Oceanithermus desulfurans TaxID=227924 RepID=A0A511RIX0_9DEIN|nr:enoyl-CoA hydratase-related protein [Oceanithermus desulfurans]MBB6029711.1 enoyl-CoA hydratase [Oceanithermus desulfurans]GEM89591.1 3-hydroxybutyryl-CoA dehydratase [Oceanithermus desulfurans NBRC 100063]
MAHEHDHSHEEVPAFALEVPEFEFLRYEVAEGIAWVTFTRPKALNALAADVLREIAEVTEVIAEDPEVKVAVFTGEGKAFVAGADISEINALKDVFIGREFALAGQEVMNHIAALPVPTIAAINGYALGGGLELALACDLRVAATKAKLGLPEVGLGLIPGFGGTQRLPRLVGVGRAFDLILTGRHVPAEEALALGLVNRVADDAVAAARELAQAIMKNSPVALALAKEAVARGADVPLPEALEIEADLFGMTVTTHDMREGTAAFLEKRAPEFKGE